MNTDILVTHVITDLTIMDVARTADQHAQKNLLADYHAVLSQETLRRQMNDLSLLERCIEEETGVILTGLASDLRAWHGITHGIIRGFVQWQLKQSYAISTINVRLGTVKAYAKLAMKYGSIDAESYLKIQSIRAIQGREAKNKDAERPAQRRENAKKAAPVLLSSVHVALLKQQPDTVLGKRDALLVCLMADLGMRVSEVCDLQRSDVHLSEARIKYYRRKVDLTQTHSMTPDTLLAMQRYLELIPDDQAVLFEGRNDARMKTRSVYDRIHLLGLKIGVQGLSPHDLRHFWATDAAKNKTDLKTLMVAGGWMSPAMPLRYIADNEVANEGVKLTAMKQRSSENIG